MSLKSTFNVVLLFLLLGRKRASYCTHITYLLHVQEAVNADDGRGNFLLIFHNLEKISKEMLASQESTASDVADDEEEGNMFAVLFYAASHTYILHHSLQSVYY